MKASRYFKLAGRSSASPRKGAVEPESAAKIREAFLLRLVRDRAHQRTNMLVDIDASQV
jgi:hypothetical protein